VLESFIRSAASRENCTPETTTADQYDGTRADIIIMMATTRRITTDEDDDNDDGPRKQDDAAEELEGDGSDHGSSTKSKAEAAAAPTKITIDGSRRVDKTLRARALYKGAGLAPMVRCSTTPLRALAFQYGANFCYTEEIVDKSLVEAPSHTAVALSAF
jgi:hypothetical protein